MVLLACTLCDVRLKSAESFLQHAASTEHRMSYLQNIYTVNRTHMIANKNDIQISATLNNDCPKYVKEDHGMISMFLKDGTIGKANVYLKNAGNNCVMLHHIVTLYQCKNIKISDKYDATLGSKIIKLNKGAMYAINFETLEGGVGVQELPVVFQFTADDSDKYFYILRILCVQFLDDISAATLPNSVFERPPLVPYMEQPPRPGCYVPGKPLPGHFKNEKSALKLFSHYYPDFLRTLVKIKFNVKRIKDPELIKKNKEILRLMNEGLNPSNYMEWYQTQLWIEEIQCELDLCRYNQINVPLFRSPEDDFGDSTECIAIKVPGMTEKQPQILLGYSVFIRYTGKRAPTFEGIVHKIVEETIYLAFSDEFMNQFECGTAVDIQFWYNRIPYIRCHDALFHNRQLRHILFPSLPRTPCPVPENSLQFYDFRVASNHEQKQAVIAMVHNFSAPAPYILFGPPGTGKTLTIVEAIKQIAKVKSDCHMLVSGPSNSCCDLLTERLLDHISSDKIIRLMAKSRQVRTIPPRVREVTLIEDDEILIPSDDTLATYKIIVTTFCTAAKVLIEPTGGRLVCSFTHVFLDECGHGQEPEALVPLLGLGKSVVLAGDPKQLGPVVHSKFCNSDGRFFKENGLDQSLLERLMNRDEYKPDRLTGIYNTRMVTKLLDNYRSHANILHVPNQLFYNSELRIRGDKKIINSFLHWKELPNKDVPLIFHGVNGKDAREGECPSYFNPQEVSRVVFYVKKLKSDNRVKAADIGIVVPYRAQIYKIRTALRNQFQEWASELRVGSPEEFQGDERRVIIVSTVRASAELLHNDIFLQLGFLRNPKRFNVAVTRAQSLLVVVGCPWLLQRDKSWGDLLAYCRSKNAYVGCNYDALKRDEISNVYEAYEQLHIDLAQGEEEE